jgi:hypothetical protein
MSFLGSNTVAELRDWVDALEYEFNQIHAAFLVTGPKWQAEDPVTYADWRRDYDALRLRYAKAHTLAVARLKNAASDVLPETMASADTEWNALNRAIRAVDGMQTKGDVQEVHNRLVTWHGPIDFSRMPQPRPGTDFDLNTYKAADTTLREGEKAIAAAGKALEMSTSTKLMIAAGSVLGLVLLLKVAR